MAKNEDEGEDEEHAPEPFRGEEALAKAREGKDAWNAWAKENPRRAVNFEGVYFTTEENKDISFEGFTFPGFVFFNNAQFPDAQFGGAIFIKAAGFEIATFEGRAEFGGAIFEDYAQFSGGTFNGPVFLGKSRFKIVPDFRRSEFKKHVTLHGMEVDFRRPTEEFDADMYRRLKELAVNARDHDREQMFFAYELIAKRGHETRGLALVPNYLYEWTSDFGRSLRRPCIGLFVVWFGFGVLYRVLATKDTSSLWDGLSFSAANLFPFLGASKGALADSKAVLFGNPSLDAWVDAWVNALGMIEGGLGILFLFLIGLALRNRFRL